MSDEKYTPSSNGEQPGVRKWPKAIETTVPDKAPVIPPVSLRASPTTEEREPMPETTPEKTVFEKNEEERRYRPIRQRRDGRIGCMGGILYMIFILAAGISLACFGWMAASDVLALNKTETAVEITLPESAFSLQEEDVLDDAGNVIGSKMVQVADIDQVAGILRDYNVINYTWLFKFYSGFSHAERKLDPGTYSMSTNLDYRAIVTKMQAGYGTTLQTLVTLPEGYNMDQIFARLEENGVCSAADLYEAAANADYSYDFLAGMDKGDASRLEGFLYPDTYYFYQGMQASSALNKFLSNSYYKITEEMTRRASELGMTMRQIMTVASLIEKEAANDDERAVIASVIYNRLRDNMLLQFDSTVIYALRSTGETTLTTALIQSTDSPYNTYLYSGLPPTPICNPGMASIQAALYPADTNYYYFALDMESNTMRFFVYQQEHEAFAATQNYE